MSTPVSQNPYPTPHTVLTPPSRPRGPRAGAEAQRSTAFVCTPEAEGSAPTRADRTGCGAGSAPPGEQRP